TTTIGDRVAFEINEWGPDAVFIDTTGGYGGGVLDYLRLLGHKIIHPVEFASSPHDPRFFNKRMEIWWEMAQWVKKEGAVPPGQQLQDDLTNPRYGFQGGRMILESKEDMKKRGLPSPDIADALACTFSATVIPAKLADAMHAGSQDFAEKQARRFDPFRGLRKRT
ncbi:MAG: terminase, partial [Ktedonobacterales bacterium]